MSPFVQLSASSTRSGATHWAVSAATASPYPRYAASSSIDSSLHLAQRVISLYKEGMMRRSLEQICQDLGMLLNWKWYGKPLQILPYSCPIAQQAWSGIPISSEGRQISSQSQQEVDCRAELTRCCQRQSTQPASNVGWRYAIWRWQVSQWKDLEMTIG